MAISTAGVVLIILGVIFLIVLIGFAVFFCCWLWRKKQKISVKKSDYFKRTSLDVSVRHHPNTKFHDTQQRNKSEHNGNVRTHRATHQANGTAGVPARVGNGYLNEGYTADNEDGFTVIKTIPVSNGGSLPHRVHKRKPPPISIPIYTTKSRPSHHHQQQHHQHHRLHHRQHHPSKGEYDYVDSTKHVMRQHKVITSNSRSPVYVYDNHHFASVRGYVKPHHLQQHSHHRNRQFDPSHDGWPYNLAGGTHGRRQKAYDQNWSMGRADYMNSLKRYHQVPIDLPLETNNNIVTAERATSGLSVDDADGTALHLKWSPSIAKRKHRIRQESRPERPPSVGSFKIATNTLPMTKNKQQLPSPIPRETRNQMTYF